MQRESHLMAGQTVTVNPAVEHQMLVQGAEFRVEDWYQNVNDTASWKNDVNLPAVLNYFLRVRESNGAIPDNNEVVYGKIGGLGYLVHVSELVV